MKQKTPIYGNLANKKQNIHVSERNVASLLINQQYPKTEILISQKVDDRFSKWIDKIFKIKCFFI